MGNTSWSSTALDAPTSSEESSRPELGSSLPDSLFQDWPFDLFQAEAFGFLGGANTELL